MPPNENKLHIFRMSEVKTPEVQWLWHPYIPKGKSTIGQGNLGVGKTTLALWIAALCSQEWPWPAWSRAHVNVLYQTAEDGLGIPSSPDS